MRQELQRAIYHELLAVASRAGIPENDAALQTAHDLYRNGQGLIFGVDDLQLEAIWTLSLRLDTYFRESAPEPKSE
jgi:hypothetical protein